MNATRFFFVLALSVFIFAERVAAGERLAKDGSPYQFQVEFVTLLGGNEYDDAREIIILWDGSLLIGGQTVSADFPVTEGVVQAKYSGEPAGTGHPGVFGGDCYLARVSEKGTLLAATFFGGSKQERDVYGMELDSHGDILITTATRSRDWPVTSNAFQRTFGGGEADVGVAKLSQDFKRVIWSTYLGGSDDESPRGGLAVDKEDNVYIVGNTQSRNFPVTAGVLGAKWKGNQDAFITKLNGNGELVWSTLLGGKGWDGIMGARVADKIYVAGHTQSEDFPVTENAPQGKLGGISDCFVAALSLDATRLLYSTYLGGTENEFAEHRVGLLKDGSVLVTGVTLSKDFPTTAGAFQRELKGKNSGFVTKVSPDGRRLVFSTLLGGAGGGYLLMPTTDASGNIYLVGETTSKDFPVTANAVQKTYSGNVDGVFAILSGDGARVLYATYLGGMQGDLVRSLAIDGWGNVFLIGKTASADFLGQKVKGNSDAFVVKLKRS